MTNRKIMVLSFVSAAVGLSSNAAVILPSDSSSDSIGETFDSGDVPEESFNTFGDSAPLDDFNVDFRSMGGERRGGLSAFWVARSGAMSLIDTTAYSDGGIYGFRAEETTTIPMTRIGAEEDNFNFFRFSDVDGFVEGPDNFTRMASVERVGSERVDVFPYWVQWDLEFDPVNGTVIVTPLAAFGEEGTALTPRQAAIAVGAIPEPSSILQLVAGFLVFLGRRRREY